ncbi:hypothetical protein H6F73_13950 [Microcoleus sp. FACHB-68]|nr:hypothetical protein [Microcoleus sp. FACHB-68]
MGHGALDEVMGAFLGIGHIRFFALTAHFAYLSLYPNLSSSIKLDITG